MTPLILASASSVRASLLRQAAVPFDVHPARIDEHTIRISLHAEGASSRDTADALAEFKAQKVASKHPGRHVLGCDQILEFRGEVLSKPRDPKEALTQLQAMSGEIHRLHTAAVLYQDDRPLWRHVSTVRMHMAERSPEFLQGYVHRNWDSIRHCVGAYQLESEGVRLFSKVEGDYFAVLGLPLLEILNDLTRRGLLPS